MKTSIVLHKILNRLRKVARRSIPHNLHYRPTGIWRVEETGAQDPTTVVVHPIYPQLVTTLDISEELYRACSAYWKPQRSVVTDYVVVEVPEGRIHTDSESSVAVISRDNRVVTNVSLSLQDGKVCDDAQNNIFRQRYFSEPHRLKGTVFTLLSGGAGVNNIGHWFLDVLPRLHLLERSGLLGEVDWFLVPSTRYSYQTETLALLGIPSHKIISSEEHPHVVADRVIASTAPRGRHTLVPRWLLDYMRGAFLKHQAPGPEVGSVEAEGPFLYISRRDSSIRNVLNEEELQGVLGRYGFNTIVSSGYSILDKIRLFSRARFVMSPTGAGLISILFCQPGTKLVEIFNEGFVIEPFYDIATKLELDYRYIICKSPTGKPAKNAAEGQRDHLVVETQQVEELLRETVNPVQ
ncbi:hypothetical protein GCM10023188_17130 [Pontibacter saemangeumensis]|uniref:Glycosyltransferase 61 catalytic domain-containing protein n=1 Tax=Pontibacter saemangeumensis TaxID=1084525 RepID=A0ABP8LIN8_9BACT